MTTSTSYPLATSERAKSARDILNAKIVDGRAKAMKVFNHVNENIPQDAIVGSHGMNFITGIDHPLMVQWGSSGMAKRIHRNAKTSGRRTLVPRSSTSTSET